MPEAQLLIQNSGYPAELQDALVFGIDSDSIRKKCITEGNELALKKAEEITCTEEATKQQLKMMGKDVAKPTQVDSLQKGMSRSLNRGKTKPLFNKQNGQQNNMSKCTRCGSKSHSKCRKCHVIKAQCVTTKTCV